MCRSISWALSTVCADVQLRDFLPGCSLRLQTSTTPPSCLWNSEQRKDNSAAGVQRLRLRSPPFHSSTRAFSIPHHNDGSGTAERDMKKTRTPSEPLRRRRRQDGAFRASRPSFCSPNLQFHPLPSRRPHQHFTSFLSTLRCLFPSRVRHLSSQALFTPRVRLPL